MKGTLYIVTNDINDKVYIGKTYAPISKRWDRHLHDALYSYIVIQTKFYRALRKYGPEHFTIEPIAQFEQGILEQKEIEYIAKYDSYYNGYNSTLGGDGYKLYNIDVDEEKTIVEAYKIGCSVKDIKEKYRCSDRVIYDILLRNNVETTTSIKVVMYDKDFNIQTIFESMEGARKYIEDNTVYASTDNRNFYRLVHKACNVGNIAYGHRWQLYKDLSYQNILFRTSFDKKAYLDGCEIHKLSNSEFYIADIEFGNKKKDLTRLNKKTSTSGLTCKNCGRAITSFSTTGLCIQCYNNSAYSNKPAKPSKEELEQLVDRMFTVNEIANRYDRSVSTVIYWMHQYGIK